MKSNAYIGIDLGTSGIKLLLVNAEGEILNETSRTYPVFHPQSGWSEQNPADWLSAAKDGLSELLEGQDKAAVKGISFGGQMHGAVLLDGRGEVVRPCILWNDGRTERETAFLNETAAKKMLSITGNIAFAGFTAPKILWLQKNEPETLRRAKKLMLPKDYLIYAFSGKIASDCSDASGTLLFDTKRRCWSEEMCALCGIEKEMLPPVYESFQSVEKIRRELADFFGLSEEVRIVAGAGDNAAAAVGMGAVGENGCTVSLGTSGTLLVPSRTYAAAPAGELHSFCHADGGFHYLGCILSAAASSDWWMSVLGSEDHTAEQAGAETWLGKNDVFFLPYLMGERCPHNDTAARGAFIGMRADTVRKQMTLAVLEGVAFALRECADAARKNGAAVSKIRLCGGGAKSALWRKIVVNVLNAEAERTKTEQGPAFGAAILAMVGCGEYADVEQAVRAVVKTESAEKPDKKLAALYEERFRIYKALYPALKPVFGKWKGEKQR